MDKAVFIKELREIFLDINQKNKRYSKVWLSDMDYGGLYPSGTYILNATAEPHIDEYSPEIWYLIDLLTEKLGSQKASYINRVAVYLENDEAYPSKHDIIIYNDEVVDKAA